LIGIHRQQYYKAINRSAKKKDIGQKVVDLVNEIRIKLPRVGTRKLYFLLKEPLKKLKVGRDKLFTILEANHLLIKPKRQYHVTTNSHHRFKKHKNLIKNIEINRPEKVFVSDITYLGHRDNPMYLALVTDAYSKKIMGFDVSNSLNAQGAIRALNMAIKNRQYQHKDLIHHSDRGLQYCSDKYQEILKNNDSKCSMTEQYDPYENAIAERINGILKQEFIGELVINQLDVMKDFIKNSIHIYNTFRPHFSNYYLTPENMHLQVLLPRRKYINDKMSIKS
jgi:transposase InsO family protein